MDYDVVIAGAGPVGLLLACELRLAGVSVLVLEKLADPNLPIKEGPVGARALNIPSIEVFYRRGLLPALKKAALKWIDESISGEGIEAAAAWDEFTTVIRLARGLQGAEEYRKALQSLTQEANASLFEHVEKCLDGFERGDRSQMAVGAARAYCEAGIERLVTLRNRFIALNVQILVDVVSADCTSGPVIIPQIH